MHCPSLVRPLTVVSDGLACFNAAERAGIHERIVTGGGKASTKLPQFKVVNTVLGAKGRRAVLALEGTRKPTYRRMEQSV